MKVIKKVDTPLLSRTRVTLEDEHFGKATPTKATLKKEAAALLNVPEELVSLRHIYTKYGIGKSKIIAHVYNKLEDLQRLEKKKEKKAKPKEELKKEEKK